ncbi:hypothetical protein [Kocuria massiliensis]|uniref:hypothetical protein n=1 Tax=Kocuria massiliensis TaxID=1926282 RepID=UPI0022B96ECB|nr:hypothetical protein [Kocuria massiliensis]
MATLLSLAIVGPFLAALIFWKYAAGYTVADISSAGAVLLFITLGATSLAIVSFQRYTVNFYRVKNFRNIKVYMAILSLAPTTITTAFALYQCIATGEYFWTWVACYLSIYGILASVTASLYMFISDKRIRGTAHLFLLVPNILVLVSTSNVHLWNLRFLWVLVALTVSCSCLSIVGKSLLNTALKAERTI